MFTCDQCSLPQGRGEFRVPHVCADATIFSPNQEQQVAVCQMLQRQRELHRLTLTGALTSTPNSPMIAQSPGLLSSATASPLQGGQGGGLFGLQDNALHKPGVSHRAPVPVGNHKSQR